MSLLLLISGTIIGLGFLSPSRSVICWKLLNKRLLTENKLIARGMHMTYRLCFATAEDPIHLFLHCSYVAHCGRLLVGFLVLWCQKVTVLSPVCLKIVVQFLVVRRLGHFV